MIIYESSNIKQQTNMKTNLSRLPLIIAAITLITLTTSLSAQVTVGSDITPSAATLLDLKSEQTAGTLTNAMDTKNITSRTGGLLLPRVKLVATSTLEPFLTDAEAGDSLKLRLAGLMVYNLTFTEDVFTQGVYTWDGTKWTTSQINEIAALTVASGGQPKAFTFYEQGTETVQPLSFSVNGGKGSLSYQWYQITGTNIHVRVGTKIGTSPAINGNTPTASSFTPTGIKKGETNIAGNCDFYCFYCEVTDEAGQKLTSNIAEVAVGCGAKNNAGEWLSFMCFNLGAENKISINDQITRELIFYNDSSGGRHYYETGEDALYGDLFQWGRIADGHQSRTSDALPYTGITADSVGDGGRCGLNGERYPYQQVKDITCWYGKFITNSTSPYNWSPVISQSTADQLWRAGRFRQNDPCAHYQTDGTYREFWNDIDNSSSSSRGIACGDPGTGWRLPNQSEWGELYKGGVFSGDYRNATANSWEWVSASAAKDQPAKNKYKLAGGYKIKPDDKTTTLFLPANGYRNSDGTLSSAGAGGFYWSSSVTGTAAYSLFITAGANVNPGYGDRRVNGMALRCIKST
jgi:uncharacterized protein (TIGR02145 family)